MGPENIMRYSNICSVSFVFMACIHLKNLLPYKRCNMPEDTILFLLILVIYLLSSYLNCQTLRVLLERLVDIEACKKHEKENTKVSSNK